ncbi:MAG: hypothetical protein IK093_00370, partial [Ruminiclostridium sp.]|nr:hypothetical protein [Ruminiclostridium sp.]
MTVFEKMIDAGKHLWCREAALVRVVGGRKALTQINSGETDEYDFKINLMLNGKPIMQGEYPVCQTCCALLARGYGIEKTDCEELKTIRDKINSDYTGFRSALSNIEPILDLLDDGYYVVAYAKLYPTDGSGHFFMNVPDEMTDTDAACSDYYNSEFLTITQGFPAYIYPTQSNSSLDTERAAHYLESIDMDIAPRAVAYYDYGFVCALLDGHHKAYAAAMKGCLLPALVIIPLSCIGKDWQTREECAYFADITLPAAELEGLKYKRLSEKREVTSESFHNEPIPETDLDLSLYPTVEELTGIYAAGAENLDVTPELAEKWLESKNRDDRERLRCVLRYYAKRAPERAYGIARTVVAKAPETPDLTRLIILSYRIIAVR